MLMSYLMFKLFEGGYRDPCTNEAPCGGLPTDWIPELVETSQKSRHKSWDALAAIVFGQAHNSHDVIEDALRLYGHALSELRHKLLDPDDRRTDSTLACMTALYMYEILVSKPEKGWMLHANGLGWLLERRGPWQQKIYAGKSIFLEHRIILVAKSIVCRQCTFLHNPVWKTVPWEDDPTSKSAIDYLVDIGTDIAEYIAQLNKSDNSESNQSLEYCQLRTQVAASIEELNTWWSQWETERAQPVIEVIANETRSKPLFPTLLEFDMVQTAFTVCIYDAMRILLLQLWHTIQLFPGSVQPIRHDVVLDIPNGTALLGITSDMKGLACEILRSLTYCYERSRRFISTGSFLFILDVAYGCFDPSSKEALWLAGHGWAEFLNSDDIEDANLLKRLFPLSQIKAGDID